MAILRSLDGRFYEIEDDALSEYELDADRAQELMPGLDEGPPDAPVEETPQVVIEIFGGDIGMDDGPPPPAKSLPDEEPADPAA